MLFRSIVLPDDYSFSVCKGTAVSDGNNAVLFTYGPVMLHEALTAGELLKEDDFSLKVINFPWLNKVDLNWFEEIIADCDLIFSLDNHSQYGGLGDSLLNACMSSKNLRNKRLVKFAIEDFPACGTPQEVLAYHKLDGRSLATRILSARDKN